MLSHASIVSNIGPVGILVLSLLLVFSILSWAIIMAKWQLLSRAIKSNNRFIDLFWETKDLHALLQQDFISPSGEVFKETLAEYEKQIKKNTPKENTYLVIERTLARSGKKQLKEAESKVSLLATIGHVSPFIGLFGTVVGIMTSFKQIGELQSASLSTVAPGLSEALLATAVGLFAAIPAVMAYNFFQHKIKQLRGDLESFCLDLLAIIKTQKD